MSYRLCDVERDLAIVQVRDRCSSLSGDLSLMDGWEVWARLWRDSMLIPVDPNIGRRPLQTRDHPDSMLLQKAHRQIRKRHEHGLNLEIAIQNIISSL
jgi:hypothetical protein